MQLSGAIGRNWHCMHIVGLFSTGFVKLPVRDLIDCGEASMVALVNIEREAR
jgi:hypothetical protein